MHTTRQPDQQLHYGDPAKITKSDLLEKLDYFVDIRLFPRPSDADVNRWLSNFYPSEMEHAIYLMNAFMYFPDWMVVEMLKGAFQSLSMYIRKQGDNFAEVKQNWQAFLNTIIITRVTGDEPNDTDSGHKYMAKVRHYLGISQSQILTPADTL